MFVSVLLSQVHSKLSDYKFFAKVRKISQGAKIGVKWRSSTDFFIPFKLSNTQIFKPFKYISSINPSHASSNKSITCSKPESPS